MIECRDAPFPLWLIHADGAPLVSALSDAERRRADRFATRRLRNRYVAAHAAVRIIVERYFGLPVSRQRYEVAEHGKFRLAGFPQVQLSISYSEDLVLIGVAPGAPIGVDIERVRPVDDALGIASSWFTPQEQAALRAHVPGSAVFDRLFLALWTRKEACVKAIGRGLSLPLATIDCDIESPVARVRIETSQLRTGNLEIRSGAFMGAWAQGNVLALGP